MISSFILLTSQQFLWCADNRQEQPPLFEIFSDTFLNHEIRDVAIIPCEQKIHVMQSGNGDMEGIFKRFGGNEVLRDQSLGKSNHLFRHREYIQSLKRSQPPARCISIASRAFLPDGWGNQEFILKTPFPPRLRKLLVGCPDNRLAGASCQVTDDGCFNVNPYVSSFQPWFRKPWSVPHGVINHPVVSHSRASGG
jgi:hypothetical protein